MSIALSKLYTPGHNPYELTLLAGGNGLSREVSWVQVMEDEEYASFLMPNELIFTTGLGFAHEPDWLQRFVKALVAAGTTGVVINVGKYILPEQITPDVIAFCEAHDFPLFTMPWHVRLADVTQAFLSSLFVTQQKEYDTVHACKELLFTPETRSRAIQRLRLQGFAEHSSYQVLAVLAPALPEGQLTRYKGYLNELAVPYILFPAQDGYILVWQGEAPVKSLVQTLTPASQMTAQYGIGMVVSGLEAVPTSYTQATQALAWAVYRKADVQYFQELGVYALLSSQANDMAMRHLHDTYVGPLLAYDAAHHRNLYETLESFLRHDGSLQAVAAETFSHRNTVLYRMKKIKALLHCEFTDGESRFPYQLACYIHRYLEVMAKAQQGQ